MPARFGRKLAISIIAGVAVFALLAVYADIKEITQSFAHFKWSLVPLILGLTFANYLLRFWKWHYYLGTIDIRIRRGDSLAIFLSGLVMSITPAKLGEVFKSYLLNRLNGTKISKSAPVVLAERVTDVLGLLILAALSFSAFEYGQTVLIVVLILLLGVIVIIKSRSVSNRLLDISESMPVLNRASDSLRMAQDSAHTLFRLRTLAIATIMSVVSWGFECLAMYFVLKGFNVDASVLFSAFVFSFSSLAGAVSMIPGGLIVAEGSSTGLLRMEGIPLGIAASSTMMIRFCTLWFGVMVGFLALLVTRRRILGGGSPRGSTD